jgi:peptidoglycan/LPS O-acetylase OafA/YrhL
MDVRLLRFRVAGRAARPARVGEALPGPVTAPGGRYAHLDALRAFAVMLVVFAHAGLEHAVPGGSGVTIFFSISGFIITFLLLRERDRTGSFSIRNFYIRRALKIAPPLVVAVLIPAVAYAAARGIDALAFASQIFFFFNWLSVDPTSMRRILPGSGVLWSLAIEEQFYIVFALIWLAAYRSRRHVSILAVVGVAGVLYANATRIWFARDAGNTWRIYFGTDTRLDAIALGVLAALVYHHWLRGGTALARLRKLIGSDRALVGAIALYLFTLAFRDPWFRDTLRFFLQSVATCTVILFGLVGAGTRGAVATARVSNWRPVRIIGLASYSLYLVHDVLIAALDPLVRPGPHVVPVAVFVAVSVAGGTALYVVVEVPFERVRARLHRDVARSVPAPPAAEGETVSPVSAR